MFNSLFAAPHTSRRKPRRVSDELLLILLRQIIRLSKFLSRMERWITPLREYCWAPVLAFLIGVIIGLVMTTVG